MENNPQNILPNGFLSFVIKEIYILLYDKKSFGEIWRTIYFDGVIAVNSTVFFVESQVDGCSEYL